MEYILPSNMDFKDLENFIKKVIDEDKKHFIKFNKCENGLFLEMIHLEGMLDNKPIKRDDCINAVGYMFHIGNIHHEYIFNSVLNTTWNNEN